MGTFLFFFVYLAIVTVVQGGIISHPSTDQCVLRKSTSEPLNLGSCTESENWEYTPQNKLRVKGTYFCLQAVGEGEPTTLSIICTAPGTSWETVSASETYLSTQLEDGTTVCLDADSGDNIVANACECSDGDDTCDPGSQGFKIEDTS